MAIEIDGNGIFVQVAGVVPMPALSPFSPSFSLLSKH
jgi:hypothetical protein